MAFAYSELSFKQKSLVAELAFLLFISVLSPFVVGLQIFSHLSFTLSLVLLNLFQLPAIILFYRLYLPFTIGRKKYGLAALLFFPYLLIYELNSRLSSLALIALPFIPEGYRNNLRAGHPQDFTGGYFNQSIGYTLLVLLAVTSLYVVQLLFRKQHLLYKLENEKLALQLDQLKAQVQPHFFFNTLNNLYSLAVHNSPKTPKMIKDLSEIMRYVLYQTQKERVSLESEIGFIKSLISLENLRHDGKDSIELFVQGNTTGVEIEPLLFLPLIENTFKHALHKNLPDKWVRFVLSIDDEEIIFQTTNPKETVADVMEKQEGGLGLKNVQQRLQLLYPNRHELLIHEGEDSFTVTLTIQYHAHMSDRR